MLKTTDKHSVWYSPDCNLRIIRHSENCLEEQEDKKEKENMDFESMKGRSFTIDFDDLVGAVTKIKNNMGAKMIKSIQVNERKRLVTVVFTDGDVRIVNCNKEDNFDVTIGVSLAISEHLFGSKTKRTKFINEKTKIIKAKEKKETKKLLQNRKNK